MVLADAGLALDTANPTLALISWWCGLPTAFPTARTAYRADPRELGKRPQLYVKVSEVVRRVDGRVAEDPNFYRSRLDEIFDVFGQDLLLYGSD